MKNLFLPAALAAAWLACSPQPEQSSVVASATEGEIVIGQFGSLAGPGMAFGKSMRNGTMLAVEEINSTGGIRGRGLRVIAHDDESRPETAQKSATTLIAENHVIALLGGSRSATALAAAPVAQSNGVPMISPAATQQRVTEIGDYIFRIALSDARQGEALAGYVATELGMTRAAILRESASDSSLALADSFARTFTASGGSIVANQTYERGDDDFRPQLAAIRTAEPDLLFVPGSYNEVGAIARQARTVGVRAPLAGSDGWDSAQLLAIGGAALEGAFYVTHYFPGDPSPAVQAFVSKYEKAYAVTPDAYAALGYDATRVLADAIERAGSIAGPAIRDAIAATRDFPGVTGNITIGPDRGPIARRVFILEIREAERVLKATVEP